MPNHSFSTIVFVVLLTICVGMTIGCWKSDEGEDTGSAGPTGAAPAVDLARDDMATLPGADVDLPLLEQFPYHLRQESSLAEDEIFAYYDSFYEERGWTLEASTDPLMESRVHRYQLGEELAFLTISELEGGRREVTLTRRQLRDDEKIAAGS